MNTLENVVETTQVLNWEAPVLSIESWEDTESLGGFFMSSPT
jgi:hypothetical protein